jgi:DNA (cytosine-5)-methyltransferase 1
VRELLIKTGKPYVIENVPGAPLRDPVMLCGTMFGLGAYYSAPGSVIPEDQFYELRRHRLFETSGFEIKRRECRHRHPVIGIYGGHVRNRSKLAGGRGTVDFAGCDHVELARQALGPTLNVEMTMGELSNAVPPAYAEYISRQWLNSRPT